MYLEKVDSRSDVTPENIPVSVSVYSSGAHEGSYAATTTSACLRNASSSLVKTGCCAMLTAKYLSYSRII